MEGILEGKGIDVSRDNEDTKGIPGAVHIYREPDGLYRLETVKNESLDFVYCNDINSTKFYPILIKELMHHLKVGGFLVLKCVDSKYNSFDMVLWLSSHYIFEGEVVEMDKENRKITIKKNRPSQTPGDSLDKWTIGVITAGKRDHALKELIKSVERQGMKNYEILIVGKTSVSGKNVTVIPFEEKNSVGWITRKANLIFKNAKYENVLYFHDRLILSDKWFEGMKKFGNNFEYLYFAHHNVDGQRQLNDWVTHLSFFSRKDYVGASLEYRDWHWRATNQGISIAMKKRVWQQSPWNETLFWDDAEDVDIPQQLLERGFIPRMNPYSNLIIWIDRWDNPFRNNPISHCFDFDSQKLGPFNKGNNKNSTLGLFVKRHIIYPLATRGMLDPLLMFNTVRKYRLPYRWPGKPWI